MKNFLQRQLISIGILSVSLNVTGVYAAPVKVADNLLIEGYYTQDGQDISRGQLEKFLLNQPYEIANLADKSKGYRLSAYAIGGPLWLAATGISIWQVTQFVKFIKRTDFNDSNALIYPQVWKFAVPLLIGGHITAFFQSRLRNHSNYLLHKAVKAYDSILCTKEQVNIIMDHQIKEVKPGWFMQDRILMPTSVLYSVLKERKESRGAANSSIVCREISISSGLISSICITNAVIGLLEQGIGEKKVKKGVVYSQLGIGIGCLLSATITSIISGGIRDKAIQKYNQSLPASRKPLQLYDAIPTEPVNYPPR